MLWGHFELLSSLINLELVLLNRICNLVLFVVFLLLCLMTGLFFKGFNDTLFLEICAGQDCRNAALEEAACTYG